MADNKKETFNYMYSAEQQEEIKKIREKYIPVKKAEDKLERLKKIESQIVKKATSGAVTLGVTGTLLLGFGMSLIMTDLAESISDFMAVYNMPAGIIFGVAGIILMSFANPVYNYVAKKERAKMASEVIRLTDELIK